MEHDGGLARVDEDDGRLASVEAAEKKPSATAPTDDGDHLKDVLDVSRVGLFVLDAQFRVVWVNQALERYFGLSREEVIGQDKRTLIRTSISSIFEDPAGFQERVFATYDDNTFVENFVCHVLPSEGRQARWLEHWSQPIVSGVYSGGRVEYYTDVTELKESEKLCSVLEAQLQHAQKLESLGVLAGGIAHDFNNILTGILGNAGLAMQELPPESPVQSHVLEIDRLAHRAAAICMQMLAYSGKGRFTVRAINLSKLVEEIMEMLEISLSEKADLQFELAEGLPAVEADASQLRQVVMNLIANASDAIGETGGAIRIHTGAMECDAAYLAETILGEQLEPGEYVFIEISDTGCGVDEETRQKIFDPFFTTKFTGRGLGLAAVLGIVRGHGGAIEVASELGQGARFKVMFPVFEDSARGRAAERKAAKESRARGTILIVDDEKGVRAVAKKILQRSGFDVLMANDGVQALEIYRERSDAIDAVLLDLTMPRLSGAEVLAELRQIRPDVRVVISSGYNEDDALTSFVGSSDVGFIQKPYRPNDLVDKLIEVLGER